MVELKARNGTDLAFGVSERAICPDSEALLTQRMF